MVIELSSSLHEGCPRRSFAVICFPAGTRCDAEQGLIATQKAVQVLEMFPFTCRKATAEDPFLRELVIAFGSAGYVALFEVASEATVNILAIRHQREDDYH